MIRSITAAAVIVAAQTAAHAGSLQVFTDRAAFDAAASAVTGAFAFTDRFETYPADDSDFFSTLFANGFDVIGEDIDNDFLDPLTIQDAPANGLFPTDGDQFLSVSSFGRTEVLLGFELESFAVGFDLTDFGDFANQTATIGLLLSDGRTVELLSGQGTDGNSAFVGIIDLDSPITGVTIRNNFSGDQYGIDNVSIYVPTPDAVALLGAAGIAGVRCRRRR
ncbi:MAG: hypothetical protein AAGD00_07775 [Planctomycetota bacterium]